MHCTDSRTIHFYNRTARSELCQSKLDDDRNGAFCNNCQHVQISPSFWTIFVWVGGQTELYLSLGKRSFV
jgi:hypothetical protein